MSSSSSSSSSTSSSLPPLHYSAVFYHSPAQLIFTILFSFILTLQVITTIYLHYHRDYPPIRAKQPSLIVAATVSAIFCFVGELYSLGLIPNRGPFLDLCVVWKIWIGYTLGGFFYSGVFLVRLYRLYVVLIVMNSRLVKAGTFSKYSVHAIGICIIFVPIFVGSIVISAIPDAINNQLVIFDNGNTTVRCSNEFFPVGITLILFVLYHAALFIYFMVKLKNVRQSFNESETKYGAICVAASAIVFILLTSLSDENQTSSAVASLRVISMGLTLTCYYWPLCFKVIIGKLFYPQETLQRFESGLAVSDVSQMEVKYRGGSKNNILEGKELNASSNSIGLKNNNINRKNNNSNSNSDGNSDSNNTSKSDSRNNVVDA